MFKFQLPDAWFLNQAHVDSEARVVARKSFSPCDAWFLNQTHVAARSLSTCIDDQHNCVAAAELYSFHCAGTTSTASVSIAGAARISFLKSEVCTVGGPTESARARGGRDSVLAVDFEQFLTSCCIHNFELPRARAHVMRELALVPAPAPAMWKVYGAAFMAQVCWSGQMTMSKITLNTGIDPLTLAGYAVIVMMPASTLADAQAICSPV